MIAQLDTQLTFFLSDLLPHNAFFTLLFRTLSVEGATLILWIIVGVSVIAWELVAHANTEQVFVGRLEKLLLTACITVLVAGGTVHFLLKPLTARERPYERYKLSAPYCPKDFSFPSGHAAIAFAGAYVLMRFDHHRKRKWIYALLAVGVSYSRIFLLCHYLGDVLVGAGYGLVVSHSAYTLIQALYRRIKS